MNWGHVLEGIGWGLAALIAFSTLVGVIANAAIKVKKAGSFTVELFVTDLYPGGSGNVTGSFDSKKELETFVASFAPKERAR